MLMRTSLPPRMCSSAAAPLHSPGCRRQRELELEAAEEEALAARVEAAVQVGASQFADPGFWLFDCLVPPLEAQHCLRPHTRCA